MFVQQIIALSLLTFVSMVAVTMAYPGWMDRSYSRPDRRKPSPDLYDYNESRADDALPVPADDSSDFAQTLEALRKRAQAIQLPAKRRNYPLIKLKKSKY